MNNSISVVLIGGLIVTAYLSFLEIVTGNGCPKFGAIPVCYIIFILFLIPLIVHIFKKNNAWYFGSAVVAWSIAALASFLQYTGQASCPLIGNHTVPLCYYSLITFSLLIILKVLSLKKKH